MSSWSGPREPRTGPAIATTGNANKPASIDVTDGTTGNVYQYAVPAGSINQLS